MKKIKINLRVPEHFTLGKIISLFNLIPRELNPELEEISWELVKLR